MRLEWEGIPDHACIGILVASVGTAEPDVGNWITLDIVRPSFVPRPDGMSA